VLAEPRTTGRYLAAFEPRQWSSVRHHFRRVAGVRDVAHIEDFTTKPKLATLSQSPTVVMNELGLMVIDPRRANTEPGSLQRLRGVSVREERVLSRATTVLHTAVPPPTNLDWLNQTSQTWALNALGIRGTDEDGEGIAVAVIDSGVAEHPDIAGQIQERISLLPGSEDDVIGHGTHCAGLIAGKRQPGQGRARYGVAPRARVVSIRVFDKEQATGEGTIRAALYLAVKRGCRVLSLAAGRVSQEYTKEDEYMGRFLVAENCVLMAAAGNDSNRSVGDARPTRAPANAPFVPAIGAMTPAARVWNDSNGTGDDPATRVDAVAPGTGIVSAWMGGGTQIVSGTSAATALAAGLAAAVWSRSRYQSASELLRQLSRTARRMPQAPLGASGNGYLQLR
jgi:subtilisin